MEDGGISPQMEAAQDRQHLPMETEKQQLLTHADRVKLLEEVMETKDQDNEALMKKIRHRMDNVGIKFPSVEVRFENLQVEASVYLGSRALPTLSNFTWNAVASLLTSLHLMRDGRKALPILHGVSGILKPGRLTLLLGPPGSGKSTLMKALSGRSDSALKVSGNVTYNGHSFGEFSPIRTAAYVPQSDRHIAEMTVRETLEFSAAVQGPGFRAQQASALRVLERDARIEPDKELMRFLDAIGGQDKGGHVITDFVLRILGLDVCSETILGDAFKRGVSGGQKKRVTTGEMIVGPRQVLFMDEISTGLDSSTTYLITRCLRHFTHATDATVLLALLQPAPETYELFDDVMLLSEGHIVYHGPREECAHFFQRMGFKCPERKGEPDFLQEVTSIKDQQQYWASAAPYMYVPVQKFAREFRSSVDGRLMDDRLKRPFPKEKSHPLALQKSKYGLSHGEMFHAVFQREWMLWKRNWFLVFAQLLEMLIMGLIGGTVFFRTKLGVNIQDGTYYLGALFFGIMSMLFNGMSDLTLLVTRLPVFYKQRDENMYPAWAWGLPTIILSLPVSAAAAAVFTGVTYYLMGFSPDPDRFFTQMLLFALVHQMALALFRLAGALGRSMVVALTFGSFLLVVLFVLGGFILPLNLIPSFWIWGFWVSPISYAQNALSVNEFLAPRWQVSAAPIEPNSTVGLVVLGTRNLFTDDYWVWIGVAAQIGYLVLFNALTIVALGCLKPWGQPQPVLSEEQLQEKVAARTGDMDAMTIAHDRHEHRRSNASSLDQFRSSNLSFAASDGRITFDSKSLARQLHADVEAMGEDGEERHGMILPFKPLSLSFHNVSYYVDMPAEMRAEGATSDKLQLLKNVSGSFRPKVLTALMGVSGAGKTTLMDVLAGRKTGGYIEGDVRVSGYPKVQSTFARIAGYCEQTDIHTPQVTVRESLMYSAWLRLPSDADEGLREDFVDEVMELVELDSLADALVGMPGVDGLSTEQRKRLTIAVELVANPSIIFMDEPTSGLDARAAAIVMRAVRNTVDTGRTVVCTIHQPSIDIFEAFDELLLMKSGGEVIYNGPLGTNSRLLIDYFEAVPQVPKIVDGYNPATWMLEVSAPAAAERMGVDFAELYKNSKLFRRNEALIEELKTPPPGHDDLAFPTIYSRGFLSQLNACLWKRNRMYWRAPSYNVVRMFFSAVMGVLMGGVFFGLGAQRSTSVEVFTVMGAMYTASLFMGFNNQATVQPLLSVERTVFYRERAAGLYGAYSYALAQGLVEIPYVLFQTLIYSVLTYAMFKLEWDAGKFLWYVLFMFLTLLYFTYYGMMAVAITPDEELATVVSSLFFGLWNVLCGFLLPGPAIPIWWKWFYWMNPVTWTLYGLVTSQLGDVTTPITEPGKVPGSETVQHFLENYFGFYHSNLGYNVLVLVGFAIGFFTIFAVALKRLNFQNR